MPLFIAQLPTAELACLQQLQGAVQHAFREVQAAEAAMVAVAQVRNECTWEQRDVRLYWYAVLMPSQPRTRPL